MDLNLLELRHTTDPINYSDKGAAAYLCAIHYPDHIRLIMTESQIRNLQQTAGFIKKSYPHEPSIGIVLGSGIGNLSKEIEIEFQLDYTSIPDFPVSTVDGSQWSSYFRKMEGKRIMAMAGRFHYYEGYTVDQVVFPVRLMKFLGVKTLLLSNAAGGMNPDFKVGDLMIITDHISLIYCKSIDWSQ